MVTREKVRYAKEQFKKSRYYRILHRYDGPGRILSIGISRVSLKVNDAPAVEANDFCLVISVQGTREEAARLGRDIIPERYHGVRILIRWGSKPAIAYSGLKDE